MIGHLSGKIAEISDKEIIVDVGGIGYLVRVLAGEKNFKTGDGVNLWTHLAVKEDALDLYGFKEKEELLFFKLLISISGIGPKSALGILSIAPPKMLEKAIATENTSYLTKVSGIGRKSAEKIILELKDKIGKVSGSDSDIKDDENVMLALKSLGYGTGEVRDALKKIPDNVSGTNERIKEALKALGK